MIAELRNRLYVVKERRVVTYLKYMIYLTIGLTKIVIIIILENIV